LPLPVLQPIQNASADRMVVTFLNEKVSVTKHALDIELPGLNEHYENALYARKLEGKDQILYDTSVRNCQKADISG
jgi:hypothetical protein